MAGEYHGKDDVLAFFGKMAEVYAGTLRLEVQDILANDDHGVLLTRERGEIAGEPAAGGRAGCLLIGIGPGNLRAPGSLLRV